MEKACVKFNMPITFIDDHIAFDKFVVHKLREREEIEKKAPHTYLHEMQELIGQKYAKINVQLKTHEEL